MTNRRTETAIWITFDKVGVHCYPDAPEEVAYLRQEHRHVFKFKVSITVHHDDREIEFHMMKNRLVALYDQSENHSLQLNHKSCEMLAEELVAKIMTMYDCSRRDLCVEVSEDGECGAEVFSFYDRPSLPPQAPRPDGTEYPWENGGEQPVPVVLNPKAAWPFPTGRTQEPRQES